jgi:DNA-binding XRE family transcriptional regulator
MAMRGINRVQILHDYPNSEGAIKVRWLLAQDYTKEFARKLRKARVAAKISIAEMAERLGTTQKTIGKIENATTYYPLHNLIMYLNEIGMDLDLKPKEK